MAATSGAVGAVNLTGTVNSGDVQGRPSVFELISQEGFSHALRPAFLHIIKTLAERYPEGRIPVFYRNFDEFYLAFDTLVQWHYFLTRGATLSESFYGLERKLVSRNSKLARVRLSYILSVILPYLQNKLEKAHRDVTEETDTDNAQGGNNSMPKLQTILKYYPYFKATIASLNLAYILAYCFGYADSHNVIFRILGMRLSYASPERAKFIEAKKSEIFQPSSWGSIKRLPIIVLRFLGESVLFGVEMGSFFMQFLDWWYSDPRRERVVLTSLPVPPPPTSGDQNCMNLSRQEKDSCPLCRKNFRNPTALSTSGVVYCYGCILPHLKQNGKCPLTSLNSSMDHLIRIFP